MLPWTHNQKEDDKKQLAVSREKGREGREGGRQSEVMSADRGVTTPAAKTTRRRRRNTIPEQLLFLPCAFAFALCPFHCVRFGHVPNISLAAFPYKPAAKKQPNATKTCPRQETHAGARCCCGAALAFLLFISLLQPPSKPQASSSPPLPLPPSPSSPSSLSLVPLSPCPLPLCLTRTHAHAQPHYQQAACQGDAIKVAVATVARKEARGVSQHH